MDRKEYVNVHNYNNNNDYWAKKILDQNIEILLGVPKNATEQQKTT